MVNGAVGATTTSYMAVCASHHVPEDADVVITEYAVNNRNFWEAGTAFDTPLTRSYERLMRWLLRLPRAPAVVMLDMFNWRDGWPFRGAYWGGSVERDTRELSLFYDAPSVSVKGGVYHLMVGNVSGYRVDNFVKNLAPGTPAEQQRDYFFYDSEFFCVCHCVECVCCCCPALPPAHAHDTNTHTRFSPPKKPKASTRAATRGTA